MRVNRHTDYALRVLLYLAARPGERATTEAIASSYGISLNHLHKVVRSLGELEVLDVRRGPGGGVALAVEPKDITLGSVVRALEEDTVLVECLAPGDSDCVVAPACGITRAMVDAREAFFASLDGVTLDTLVRGRLAARLRTLTGD